MKKIILLIFTFFSLFASAQVVYEDINNTGIYDFLDELANLQVIEINAVVKPFSRQFIAYKLKDVLERLDVLENTEKRGSLSRLDQRILKLNKRQRKELIFYWQDYQLDIPCDIPDSKIPDSKKQNLNQSQITNHKFQRGESDSTIQVSNVDCVIDYDHKLNFLFKKKPEFAVPLNPLAFQYKDKLFALSVRPILGYYYYGNENALEYRRYWGGSVFGYIGRNFGFYASLRDNEESTAMAKPEYFTLAQGQVYKGKSDGGVYFSEMRGGITVKWNWGSFGLMNDRFAWGTNYHDANIISGKAPSFPYIQLHINPVKWLDFNYIHGWLNSNVIDSTRSYYTADHEYRVVFRNKFIAANMITIIPFKRLNLSFGNSIIYSDVNVNPLYLIPFMFFNALDATRVDYFDPASSNSQLFFDISCRQINHLHLYVTLFIDELKMSRVTDPDLHNFTSWKAGFRVSDLWLRNTFLTFEWTKTNPGTYQHYILATTFASNDYCLGNYLRDNSFEYYIALGYRPIRGLFLQTSYTLAAHGDDYTYNHTGPSIVTQPYMKNKTWQNSEVAVSARYEYSANAYFFLEYLNSARSGDVRYQPEFMHGKTNTLIVGVNMGF